MVDIKCTVFTAGSPFRRLNRDGLTAARIGFRACCGERRPHHLEPWVTMEVTVGEEYAGTNYGDIPHAPRPHCGHRRGFRGRRETVIKTRAPYAEVINYTADLRSMTRGSGSTRSP